MRKNVQEKFGLQHRRGTGSRCLEARPPLNGNIILTYNNQLTNGAGYLTSETDPTYTSSQAAQITATDINNLSNLSGTNTGDQDLSSLATKTALGDSTAQVRSEIPDVSGIAANTQAIQDTAVQLRADIPTNNNKLTNGAGYLTSYTETQKLEDVISNGNLANAQIKNVSDPTDAQDAATKAYVDALLARIDALEDSEILRYGFTDTRDGNHYNAIKIGDQIWMTENLKYLPSVVGSGTGSDTTPYFYLYGYEGTDVNAAKATGNYTTYGVLYNWPAAISACPDRWHLPSDDEWKQLEDYLIANGYNYDGTTSDNKIAKSLAAKTHWATTNNTGAIGNDLSANNSSGFSGLPGGLRDYNSDFYNVGSYGYWWSATDTEDYLNHACYRLLLFHEATLRRVFTHKNYGYSVRCLRD